jgi:hypothetical protein
LHGARMKAETKEMYEGSAVVHAPLDLNVRCCVFP